MENAMSRGFPSMTAFLGLLAVAGYQNRDKIAELIAGLRANPAQTPGQERMLRGRPRKAMRSRQMCWEVYTGRWAGPGLRPE